MGDLFIVHCVDTEGPFWEPLESHFARLEQDFGIELPATWENVDLIQRGDIIPPEKRQAVRRMFAPERLEVNASWDAMDRMFATVFDRAWRTAIVDSQGYPYALSWFCVDHINFIHNPSRLSVGCGVLYRYVKTWMERSGWNGDCLGWHYHPVSFTKSGDKQGTHLHYRNGAYESLAHWVLDHRDFPAAVRPGFHMERVELSHFLELFIPFDFAHQNKPGDMPYNGGRFQDWRSAPADWVIYHPDWYDPQLPGAMKRWIGRCLNVGTSFCTLDEAEVDKAFRRARQQPTLMAYADHDYRNVVRNVERTYELIRKTARAYSDVRFHFVNAVEGMRDALSLPAMAPIDIDVEAVGRELVLRLSRPCFGIEPFFCFQTWESKTYHDHLFRKDPQRPLEYRYRFDSHTLPLEAVAHIGFAVNDETGNTTAGTIDLPGFKLEIRQQDRRSR